MPDPASALAMLDAFASVGVKQHDVTMLTIDGRKRVFRPAQSVQQLHHSINNGLLDNAEAQRLSVIVRPRSEAPVQLIQCDDINAETVDRLKPVSFLAVCTSPSNFQSWIALDASRLPSSNTNLHIAASDIARRLRKGVGADLCASGAVRLAGSVNYKKQYAPDYPLVKTLDAQPGRIVATLHLESLGLLMPKEERQPWTGFIKTRNRRWPDYQRCLVGAPPNHAKTGPDISRADFTFALIAASWGWNEQQIATRLQEVSEKGQQEGAHYCTLTATKAAAIAVQQRGFSR